MNNTKKAPLSFVEVEPTLRANGYDALPIWTGTKTCYVNSHSALTSDDIAALRDKGTYSSEYKDKETGEHKSITTDLNTCGTGIRCGNGLLGLDVDFADSDLSELAMTVLLRHLPEGTDPIVRVGNAPAFLVPVQIPKGIDRGRVTLTFTHHTDKQSQKLEFLGRGNYFVASGIHPDTKKRYSYSTQQKFTNVSKDELPMMSWEQLVAFVADLEAQMLKRGYGQTNETWASQGERDDTDNNGSIDPDLEMPTENWQCKTLNELQAHFENIDFRQMHYTGGFNDKLDLLKTIPEIAYALQWGIRDITWMVMSNVHFNNEKGREAAFEILNCREYDESKYNDEHVLRDAIKRAADSYGKDKTSTRDVLKMSGLVKVNKLLAEAKDHKQRHAAAIVVDDYTEQFGFVGSLSGIHKLCDTIKSDDELTDSYRRLLDAELVKTFKRAGVTAPRKPEREKLLLAGDEQVQRSGVDPVAQIMGFLEQDCQGRYFMDQAGNPYVSLVIDGKRRSYKNESKDLKRVIVWECERCALKMPKYDRDTVYERIDAKAARSGDERQATKRYGASSDGTMRYEHLCDDEDTVIEISAGKVRVVDEDIACVFVRGHDSVAHAPYEYVNPKELPERIDEIVARYFPPNLNPDQQNQILGSMVDVSDVSTPNSPTEIVGGSNSGKSTLAEFMMMMTDAQSILQAAPSGDVRSLRTNLVGNRVVVEQNVTNYNTEQKNVICTAADGASIKEYKMRENSDEQVSFDASGWFIATGINPVMVRDDLDGVGTGRINRVELPGAITDYSDEPTDIRELRKAFDADLPRVRNTLRALTAEVMRLAGNTNIRTNGHRYSNYARTCNTIARVRGQEWTYAAMSAAQAGKALEQSTMTDVLAQELYQLLQGQRSFSWKGKAGTLQKELNEMFKGLMQAQQTARRKDTNYPADPARLARRLNDPKFLTILRMLGIEVAVAGGKSNGGRLIELAITDTSTARAEQDMALSRKRLHPATADDFSDLDIDIGGSRGKPKELYYSPELRKAYPLQWLEKHPPETLNNLPPMTVFDMYFDDPEAP